MGTDKPNQWPRRMPGAVLIEVKQVMLHRMDISVNVISFLYFFSGLRFYILCCGPMLHGQMLPAQQVLHSRELKVTQLPTGLRCAES